MPKEKNSRWGGDERLFLIIVIALAAIAAAGSWFAATALSHRDQPRGIPPDHPRQLADFSLTDRTGRTVTRAELDGKFAVVSFLFTGCAQTCPEVTRRMTEIQRLTADQPDVQLLSLTVDPRSDTPAVLANWGARFGADTNRWFLLTGPKAGLYQLISTSFLTTNAADPFNSMPGNFTGTERIAVVDREGRVRRFYDGLQVDTPAAVAAELASLRKQAGRPATGGAHPEPGAKGDP
jgi:cytochrome oxidase Cu insertion factor (SCO1/SenC/PrrC family)